MRNGQLVLTNISRFIGLALVIPTPPQSIIILQPFTRFITD